MRAMKQKLASARKWLPYLSSPTSAPNKLQYSTLEYFIHPTPTLLPHTSTPEPPLHQYNIDPCVCVCLCCYSLSLSERRFSTLDMYRELQDLLTPAGLAWFQSDWDSSLTNFFHNTLSKFIQVCELLFNIFYDYSHPLHSQLPHNFQHIC